MRWVFRQFARGSHEMRDLDVYDIAFLAGGARRVADSAMVALNRRGLLVVHKAQVRTVGGELPGHAVERRVLAFCGRTRSVDSVRADLHRSLEGYEIGRRLAAWGLVKGADRRVTRSGRRHLEAAGRDASIPEYVLRGAAGVLDATARRPVGRPVGRAQAVPRRRGPTSGRRLPRMDGDSDPGSHSGSYSDGGGGGGGGDGGGGGE
ncbi:TIGR04222 domain-containing membrane protein [Streptomyces sp. NBC_00335]|uniref:TIGR04222 domain-containing membrane protein n=1 Tax=unclassified Streptomyces TaxID=2593676 RepID=UPI00224D8C26|nr:MULTISPECIES: TIGR04222 domain-containing membrane protein [unclassified Streptomyces]MCX5405822.1 TIGR04222 domain-containing membrane protein [Streptomyces sp. NBC_00086]